MQYATRRAMMRCMIADDCMRDNDECDVIIIISFVLLAMETNLKHKDIKIQNGMQ